MYGEVDLRLIVVYDNRQKIPSEADRKRFVSKALIWLERVLRHAGGYVFECLIQIVD